MDDSPHQRNLRPTQTATAKSDGQRNKIITSRRTLKPPAARPKVPALHCPSASVPVTLIMDETPPSNKQLQKSFLAA